MADRFLVATTAVAIAGLCAFGVLSVHHIEVIAPPAAAAIGLTLGSIGLQAVRHARLAASLARASTPRSLGGATVRVGELPHPVFVAGLREPTIFCDHRTRDQLSPRQLRAVLLHEQAHQSAKDPIRLVVLAGLAPLLRWLPFGRQWLALAHARREIVADGHAVRSGARRSDLAGALLALPAMTEPSVAGFSSAADLRLRALLGDDLEPALPLPVRRAKLLLPTASSVLLGAAWVAHDYVAPSFGYVCC